MMSAKDEEYRHLARSLQTGRLTATLEQRLDELLIWLGNDRNPTVAELDAAILRQGLDRDRAAARAYVLLDQLLFADPDQAPHRTLGLPAGAAPQRIKQRYRRLIQAFHPDRRPARASELTRRTERINAAYAACIRSGPQRSRARDRPRRAGTDRRPPSRHSYEYNASPSLAGRLRRSLGAADTFRTRFFAALILICGSLLGGLFYLDQSGNTRRPVVREPIPLAASRPALPEATAPATAQQSGGDGAAGAVTARAEAPEIAESPGIGSQTVPAAAPTPKDSAATDEPSGGGPDAPDPAAARHWDRLRATLAAVWPIDPQRLGSPELVAVSLTGHSGDAETAEPRRRAGPPPRPATAARAEPAPEAAERVATADPGAFDCNTVHALLGTFRRYYNTGELERFMALYSPAARENGTQGRSGIRRLYADWFRRSSARRFAFTRIVARPDERDRCTVTADYRVSYLDERRQPVSNAGRVEFLFERRASGYRILRVSY